MTLIRCLGTRRNLRKRGRESTSFVSSVERIAAIGSYCWRYWLCKATSRVLARQWRKRCIACGFNAIFVPFIVVVPVISSIRGRFSLYPFLCLCAIDICLERGCLALSIWGCGPSVSKRRVSCSTGEQGRRLRSAYSGDVTLS